MNFIVPPGGFAGFNQMTAASRRALTPGTMRSTATRRRRRKATRKGKSAAPRAKGRKMKFGSPAWQKKYRVGKFAKKRRG